MDAEFQLTNEESSNINVTVGDRSSLINPRLAVAVTGQIRCIEEHFRAQASIPLRIAHLSYSHTDSRADHLTWLY